ncbi:Box C/D snoRNA protein 1 [Geodia barretti]|uniref:Box C/D snoRNA protein 1 n=2 Tax=Geodia barretti TaxID=519541 RepID=A0AA35XBF3_GEOBA|nr:Box C/D snoRNA protein 1 [Geodia barretti]
MEEQGSMCESCGVERGRYKCPGCGVRSCSVQCVKRHKTERRCEGKRSNTNYVSLSEFTTSHLLSDYYFLEEAGRMIDSAHRGLQNIGRDTRERRQRLQRVRTAARKRGISLQLCPQGMVKHQANTSCTIWNKDRRDWGIQWRVRLVFPLAGQEFTEERVCEDKSLEDLLKRYIHPTESNPVIRHRLKRYVGQEVAVFLKVEKTNSATYCQIRPQKFSQRKSQRQNSH